MTTTDKADRLANSVWLTLASRLSMASFVPLLLVAWLYIDGRFEAIASSALQAAATADDASDAVTALATRITVVETNMESGRKNRDRQFDALTALIGDLQRTQTSTLQAVASLQATVEAMRSHP
jgi:hypothetical protein